MKNLKSIITGEPEELTEDGFHMICEYAKFIVIGLLAYLLVMIIFIILT